MECKETLELLPAHLDRELGLPEAMAIDKHLQTCPACQRELVNQSTLSAALKKHATYFSAPDELKARILDALPPENKSQSAAARRVRAWVRSWSWLSFGTALASVVALVWSAGLYLATPSAQDLLADEVVASHVRSLMLDHIADVASSDRHTVKPWFNGKLDFSPPVIDLSAQGFPLVGGRLDYVDHRPVAALVYRRRQHLINVYIWPIIHKQQAATKTMSSQGYHLLHWVEAGMAYWVVSDLNTAELSLLPAILGTQSPA